MAESNITEFVVKIPENVLPMIEYCAKAQGWRPKITDTNGQEIDNPTSAVQVCFALTVQVVKANAINALAAEAAEQARQQAVAQMEAAATSWQTEMQSSQSNQV